MNTSLDKKPCTKLLCMNPSLKKIVDQLMGEFNSSIRKDSRYSTFAWSKRHFI